MFFLSFMAVYGIQHTKRDKHHQYRGQLAEEIGKDWNPASKLGYLVYKPYKTE